MATYHKSFFMIFIMTILFLCLSRVADSFKSGGITLNLHHRDALSGNDIFSQLRSAFRRSFSRQKALRKASLGSNLKSLDSLGSTLTPIGGEYLMKFKIGTPPVEIIAIADTGSDLTWTQCLPCTECYKQKSPYFDPQKTSTYRQLSCTSNICSRSEGLGSSCTVSNLCSYETSYGDSSYSRGDLSSDKFTFDSDSAEESLEIPNVVFGCGHENGGTFNNIGSGMIGLGGGDVSIIRQLDKYIDGKFSYCLTYLDSNASSKISFGSNAVVSGPNVVSTPLVKKSVTTFYYLTLEGISVGEKRFLNSRFEHHRLNYGDGYESSVEHGNMIIDSGTTLTFVPQSLYDLVESELEKSMNGKRVDDPQVMFGLCYDVSSIEDKNVPQIIAHFTGADVALPQGAVFIEVSKGVACLTLVVSQDLSIFGNLHQMNYHIGYDLENQKIDFLPTDCSKMQ